MEQERLKLRRLQTGDTETGRKEADIRQFSTQRRDVIKKLKDVRTEANAEQVDALVARTGSLKTGDWAGLDKIVEEGPALGLILVDGVPLKPSQVAGIREREKRLDRTQEAALGRMKIAAIRDLSRYLPPEQLKAAEQSVRSAGDMEDIGDVIAASPRNQFEIALPDGTTVQATKEEVLRHFYRTAPQLMRSVENELQVRFGKTRFDATEDEIAQATKAAEDRVAGLQTRIAEARANALADVIDPRDQLLYVHEQTLGHAAGYTSARKALADGYHLLNLKGQETVKVGARLKDILDDMRGVMLGGFVDETGEWTGTPGKRYEGIFQADPGLFNRLIASGGNWTEALRQSPKGRAIRLFEDLRQQYLAIWSRGFNGETGHTTEGDVGRAETAFASALPTAGLTDTRAYAEQRLNILEAHVNDLLKRAFGKANIGAVDTPETRPWRTRKPTAEDVERILGK